MSFSIKSIAEGTSTVLIISGDMNEDAAYEGQILALGQPIVLDMEGVTSINSVGIREWIKWIKSLPENVPLSVRKAPKIIVDQINMISGFLPPGTAIESFFVPYFSEATNNERMILFTKGKEYEGANVTAPEDIIDDSGNPMEMDVIAAKYFKFLKGT
jgi:anti-anti-sigma regulatory factor